MKLLFLPEINVSNMSCFPNFLAISAMDLAALWVLSSGMLLGDPSISRTRLLSLGNKSLKKENRNILMNINEIRVKYKTNISRFAIQGTCNVTRILKKKSISYQDE